MRLVRNLIAWIAVVAVIITMAPIVMSNAIEKAYSLSRN